MKKLLLGFVFSSALMGCNDKPEIQPYSRELAAYPNPNSGQFSVNVAPSAGGPQTLQILDTEGKKLREVVLNGAAVTTVNVDVTDKANGYYHVVLKSAGGSSTIKVLKQ